MVIQLYEYQISSKELRNAGEARSFKNLSAVCYSLRFFLVYSLHNGGRTNEEVQKYERETEKGGERKLKT